MVTSHEYSNGIFYDRWYNELGEKQVVIAAAHIIRQDIHRMVYDSYTYPEPMSITFTAPESMSFVTVLRKNMGRNMRLQSCIWIKAVTSDDDIMLNPIMAATMSHSVVPH